MKKRSNSKVSAKHLRYGTALALVSFFAGNQVWAQETTPATTQDAKPVAEASETIVVIGTRQSQQSAIKRKKNAPTAMDSIIAEDVGAFPDRNIGEAISRIAGTSLDRGEYGEGVGVTVRGNGPELTRVELDGQSVQSASGADLNGGGDGRGTEFRQLPSDLIKSVDVVKGSTADMTEGALGGGIIIKTRTGLDFKKPYLSLRVSGAQTSINKNWVPDFNLIATTKFLDNRLAVLINVSKSKTDAESHQQTTFANSEGYRRLADFDNSPDKTFSFNPNTVSKTNPAADQQIISPGFTVASPFAETPNKLVAKSAAAATKADCYAAFPNLTATDLAQVLGTTNKNGAIAERNNELFTCLNQWNDYTPSNIRSFVKRQAEDRKAVDLRFDFKVNKNLIVYTKLSSQTRVVLDDTNILSLGGPNFNTATVSTLSYFGPSFTDNTTTNVRTAVPGSGYYIYDAPSFRATGAVPVSGTAVSIIPSSVVVDASHHLTSFTTTDAGVSMDQIHNVIDTKTKYGQIGAEYKNNGFKADFMLGVMSSNYSRFDERVTGMGSTYGSTTMSVLPNGLWNYAAPAGSSFDQTDPNVYVRMGTQTVAQAAFAATINNPAIPAYTVAQLPQISAATQIQWTPKIGETGEKTAKVDLSYALQDKLPWITQIKSGFNARETTVDTWAGAGSTGTVIKPAVGTFGAAGYVPPVIVPTSTLRGTFSACQDNPGSLGAGGKPCVYGYTANTNLVTNLFGSAVFTPAQLLNMVGQTLKPADAQFFGGLPGRSASQMNGWSNIDIKKFVSLVGMPNFNFDCLKSCMANDGKIYDQPKGQASERATAGYLMADFEKHDLPFGMEFTGNLGARVVKTEITGKAYVSFTSITKTALFDPINPTAAAGIQTNSLTAITNVSKQTTDLLPSYNYALWVIPSKVVLRYTYGKTVARPPVSRLLPSGACTYDERKEGGVDNDGSSADQTCTTFGNPGLKAQSNSNQNLSVEWYPNKDYMFSLAKFKSAAKIGPFITQAVTNSHLFTGSDAVDPQTGKPLANYEFAYTTYVNGPGTSRNGVEFASKSAFTFLPWVFKYTGLDLNYSKLHSSDSVTSFDPNTGTPVTPRNESAYTINASLWYDDGSLSARLAYQGRATYYAGYATSNVAGFVYPTDIGGFQRVPYNPASPIYRSATGFMDAKVSYKFKQGIEIFAEARNINLKPTSDTQGQFVPFSDGAPSVANYFYSGRRIMAGLNYRTN